MQLYNVLGTKPGQGIEGLSDLAIAKRCADTFGPGSEVFTDNDELIYTAPTAEDVDHRAGVVNLA